MTIRCVTYREDGETVRVFRMSQEVAQELADGKHVAFESDAVSVLTPSKYRFEIE